MSLLKLASSRVNEMGKSYYQLIFNFDQLKSMAEQLPNVNTEYCDEPIYPKNL